MASAALLAWCSVAQTPSLLDLSFDPRRGANNDVFAIALQPDGKILVAGQFGTFDGTNRSRIARLNPDGSLDLSFDPGSGANGDVYAVAVQADGRVLLAGNFTAVNGITSQYLARLQTNGAMDTAFAAAVSTSINNELRCLAVQPDGRVIIGGRFTKVAGQTRGRIARLNADGTLDTSFGTSAGADNNVRCLLLQADGRILIGGTFTTYNGVARSRLARLNPDGSLDASFDPGSGADDQVRAIAEAPDGRLYIGGDFEVYNGTNRSAIARLFPNGGLDLSFDQGDPDGDTVRAIAVQADGRVWIGGQFSQAGGLACANLARLNPDGSADTSFAPLPAADDEVFALIFQPDGRVLASGKFDSIDGLSRRRVVRLLPDNRAVAFEVVTGSLTVAEDVGTAQVAVRRRGWQGGTNTVEATTADDTALAGEDYTDTTRTLTFLPLEMVKTLDVPILNDLVSEGSEWFRVRLSNPGPGATLGAMTNCVVVITDNDFGFYFTASSRLVLEQAGTVGFVVHRGTDPVGTTTVDYAAVDGTARNGSDFLLQPGTLTFLPGQTQQTIVVTLLTDAELEGPESFQLVLSNPSPGSFLGNPASLTVTIEDHDSEFFIAYAPPGREPDGWPQCDVCRRGRMTLPATVRVRTSDGTATANLDYVPVDHVLEFAPGEQCKAVVVRVLNDGLAEGDETFNLSLSEPTGQAVLIAPSHAIIPIYDNDAGVQFTETNLFVGELGGSVVLVVRRDDDGQTTESVRFSTVAGTALPGQDFIAVSGVLHLPPGGSNTITIPLLYDCALEPEETFNVVLSEPSPGISLGAATNARVTIIDTERGGSVDLSFNAAPVPPHSPITVSALAWRPGGPIWLGNMYGLWPIEPDGTVGTNHLRVPMPVTAAVALPDGKVLAGLVGCVPSSAYADPVVRLNPDGGPDPEFAPCLACGEVVALAGLADGKFVASGTLSFCTGPARTLARFFADGALDLGFTAPPELRAPSVLAAQTDQKLLAGWVDGPPTLLRLLTNGAVDPGFHPVLGYASPTGNDAGVRSLLLQPDGKIVISGHFQFVNDVPRRRLARLNPDGSVDLNFDPGAGLNASAAALARQPDGKIILAGRFTSVDGVACNQLARLNPDGSLDRSFDVGAGPNGTVDQVLVLPDGQIMVAGAFDQFGGVPRETLVRLNGGAAPTRLTAIARRAGAVTELQLEGARCHRYVVEASADLRLWVPLSTNQPVAGQILLRDTHAGPQRFYRARALEP